MNWTEGSLARHSRTRQQRNALIARQKQHFAKARSGLLSTRPKPGSVSISFLQSQSSSASPRRSAASSSYGDRLSTPPRSRELPPKRLKYEHNDAHEDLVANFDRRKRLLQKPDWAGLKLQQPLEISFPGQIYATKRWARAACHRERAPSEPREYATVYEDRRYEHRKRSSMRIQIGDQEIQPSIETGSQPSTKRHSQHSQRSVHRAQIKSNSGRKTHYSEHGPYGHLTSDDSSRSLSTLLSDHESPVNVIHSTPQAICAPIPRRISDSQVPEWISGSSEDRESMEVETEQPIRLVPPSQESDQERWKNWMLCEESSNPQSNSPVTATTTSQTHAQGSESSAIALPSHLQHRLPSFRLSSEPDPAPSYNSTEYSLESIRTEEPNDSDGTHQDGLYLLENDTPLLSNQQRKPPKKLGPPEDPNDVWRKFACGDDEDSEEILKDAFKEAAHQAAVELRPYDTSSSMGEYTETAATCGTDHLSKYDHTSLEAFSEGSFETKGAIGSETALSIVPTIESSDELPSNSLSIEISSEMFTATTKGTTGLETALSTAATVGSSDKSTSKPASFILPKAFVGKYVNTNQASVPRAFDANVSKRGKKGRKRRKTATDGRTDIRSLPDFDGDPIEEIEED
ncbi:hypothetical protein F4678DRAFT_54199 [Xylaria arbuscula]|nr:hypothetical protein F4678DRAFT_54199 [Xylaria arbuscula]